MFRRLVRNFSKLFLGKNFWKNYFKVYDTLNNLLSYKLLLNKVIFLADIKDNEKILDAGCGTGNLYFCLKKNNINYYGIDNIEEALKKARDKFKNSPKAFWSFMDLSKKLDFSGDFFDVIIFNNVIYSLTEKGRDNALSEFYRVLKPKGRLVITFLKKKFSPKIIYFESFRLERRKRGKLKTYLLALNMLVPTLKIFFYNFLIKIKEQKNRFIFYKHAEIRNLLKKSDFENIKIKNIYAGQAYLVFCSKPGKAG
jgi:ubiquinone/menaquinone biosynthesis C-methylase UbiE